MKSHILNGRWIGAFLLIAVALCIMPAAPAQAGGDAKGGGVFLIISLEEAFDLPEDLDAKGATGSDTVFVQIGSLVAGNTIYSTRYKKDTNVPIKLPGKYKWKDLNGFAYTVLGAFNAPFASVHLVSPVDAPDTDPIPRKVQEAFFVASPELTDELEGQFPTTVEIAQFIYETATASAGPSPDPEANMGDWLTTDHSGNPDYPPDWGVAVSPELIMEHIFRTESDQEIDTTGDVFAEAEGDLFPHNPGNRLFGFDVKIEKTKKAKINSDMDLDVVVDIKPGNADNVIEKTDNGVVWAAILTTTQTVTETDGSTSTVVVFNAADEVDTTTVILGDNSSVEEYKKEDVDHDGYDDITMKFRVADIGLDTGTTEVPLTGKTTAAVPMNITGSDHVTVKK